MCYKQCYMFVLFGLRARLRRNVTMSHAFSCVQSASISLLDVKINMYCNWPVLFNSLRILSFIINYICTLYTYCMSGDTLEDTYITLPLICLLEILSVLATKVTQINRLRKTLICQENHINRIC